MNFWIRLAQFVCILVLLLAAYSIFSEYGTQISRYLHRQRWWNPPRTRCTGNERYPNFGILLPNTYTVHGIDVSHYQSRIDWPAVKSMRSNGRQLEFVFMRATMGSNRADAQFQQNWQAAGQVGLLRGAYHFYDPAELSTEQANNFLSAVDLKKGDLPPVLDVEITKGRSDSILQTGVQNWLTLVEKKVGVKPILYTNADFYDQHLADVFDDYPLWVAHYYERKPTIASRTDWSFWQHHDAGRVNGICGAVDFNVFNGSLSELQGLGLKAG